MKTIKKAHAEDYLIEYISNIQNKDWLVTLIHKVITSNGRLDNSDKQDVFKQLLYEYDIEPNHPNIRKSVFNPKHETDTKENKNLIIKKINHIKGVNALVSNSPITLSQACTIFYGLNGTGKSGYFRVLNELSGGTKPKQILSNIRNNSDETLEVDIEYTYGNETLTYKWENKEHRGIHPFNIVSVFDSEYLPIFLNERESSVNLEPLGLHLFQSLTQIIEDFKDDLSKVKEQVFNKKPNLKELVNIIHSEDLRNILQKNKLSQNDRKKLNSYLEYSKEDNSVYDQYISERKTLESNNLEDRLKILTQEKKDIDSLRDHLISSQAKLEELTVKINNAIKDCIDKKKLREQRAKEFEVIKNIPAQESGEWQSFIESAEEYQLKLKNTGTEKLDSCIYCNQPLGEKAINLLHAYTQYLGDRSQQDYKASLDTLAELNQELNLTTTDYKLTDFLNTHLIERKINKKENAQNITLNILRSFKEHKDTLNGAIQDMNSEFGAHNYDLSTINEELTKLSELKKNEINSTSQSEDQKQQRIIKIKALCHELEDKKNISSWKNNIEHNFTSNLEMEKYENAIKKLSTRDISQLSSKAHNELLTESIRKSFEAMLQSLRNDLEVTFSKPRGSKGSVHTKLEILGNDVAKILSDGEQKAVALALFLAEVENQNNSSPIVFDDPVTSVDHEVADLLAKKLLELSTCRQLIIFTHNKLFYSSLIYWGNNLKDTKTNTKTHHICKNYTQIGCNGKGIHICTYRVDKEDKDNTGKIFEAQNECCRYYIEKAENELKKEYSISCVAGYLKSAIEHYIDENILLEIGLLKDRNRGIGISWDKLKSLESKRDTVEKLKDYWDALSNRGSHSTQGSSQNPIKLSEFKEMITFLKS